MPRGKKICPECSEVNGLRVITCSCGYAFTFKKAKVRKSRKVKNDSDGEQQEESYKGINLKNYFVEANEEPDKISPRDHAIRILSYGRERAASLFHLAKKNHSWSHVDWDYVEEQLEKVESK